MSPLSIVTDPKRLTKLSTATESLVLQPHSAATVQSGIWANKTIGVEADLAFIVSEPGKLFGTQPVGRKTRTRRPRRCAEPPRDLGWTGRVIVKIPALCPYSSDELREGDTAN